MHKLKGKLSFVFFILIFLSTQITAQIDNKTNESQTLQLGIDILKRYFYDDNEWYVARSSVGRDVKGLIDFISNEPIDTVVGKLNQSLTQKQTFVFRLPENVKDSLFVPGFFSYQQLQYRIDEELKRIEEVFANKQPDIPASEIANLESKLDLVPPGKGFELFEKGIYIIPVEYQIPEVIPDSVLNSTEDFNRLLKADSLRDVYIEQKRLFYNDSVVAVFIDSLNRNYRLKELENERNYQIRRLTDSVKVNNYNVLRVYNESVVNAVNDSIANILATLVNYAGFKDSTRISILNYSGSQQEILLKNGNENFTRIWLKNVQNDSLSVLIKSSDKRTISMLIDDGVTFSRYKPNETREYDFQTLEKNIKSLTRVGNTYNVVTPWIIGGDGYAGFSQTYLSNWEKGGQSAVSSLIVLKGFANYSRADKLVKWENSGELRNGWVYQGGDQSELQKNDDKLEITSRFGVSAYKKWYYSAEFNFNTQLFRGYKYPKNDDAVPYSGFLAPARTFFKIGMEYKPTKEFSLLVSPLTVKNVFVRDTSLIDQTKFGIDAGKKSFWEPGLNADIYYKKTFNENIVFESKYKMFVNYKDPLGKQDINWENIVNMKLNEFINMRFLLHLIYDDNVKPGEKAKVQVKEFFSIGFAYKINHKVMHSKRIR